MGKLRKPYRSKTTTFWKKNKEKTDLELIDSEPIAVGIS